MVVGSGLVLTCISAVYEIAQSHPAVAVHVCQKQLWYCIQLSCTLKAGWTQVLR